MEKGVQVARGVPVYAAFTGLVFKIGKEEMNEMLSQ